MDPSVLELVCELGAVWGSYCLGSGCQREESCSEELPCPQRVSLKCPLRNDKQTGVRLSLGKCIKLAGLIGRDERQP